MIKHGIAPYLECSSKGYTQLSAFYARIKGRDNKTIEEIYQGAKIFEDGTTGLHWKQAKGKKAVNTEALGTLYQQLWEEYFEENPELYHKIQQYQGFSDMFGQEGHNCQANSIYNIWVKYSVRKLYDIAEKYEHLMVLKADMEEGDVYCGRPSKWGNPFSSLSHSKGAILTESPEASVAHYRFKLIQDMKSNPELKETIIQELRGKRLVCFCKGKHICHTTVLLAIANEPW